MVARARLKHIGASALPYAWPEAPPSPGKMWLAGAIPQVPQACCVLNLSGTSQRALPLPIIPIQTRVPDFVPYAHSKIRFTFSLFLRTGNKRIEFFFPLEKISVQYPLLLELFLEFFFNFI